jgi:spermidine synthase
LKPTERLAEATAPDGTVMTLYRHDGAYIIRVEGIELMSTRRTHSEIRMAQIACEPLALTADARVLIGGLGFGFTLRESLRILPADAQVTLAEIMKEVIEWNRNPEWELAHAELMDPRVTVRRDDVANVLRANVGTFDAVLLDVDNGAETLTTGSNKRLYNDKGITAAIASLRPYGCIIYWSVDSEPAFVKALTRLGLHVTVERIRAHSTSGGYNFLICGTRASEAA